VAEAMKQVGEAPEERLSVLAGEPGIDPGEAQLLAIAAGEDAVLLSGDKRAIRVVARLAGFADLLHYKICGLEAAALGLCLEIGVNRTRAAMARTGKLDTMLAVCFSAANPSPMNCLKSYIDSFQNEVTPLRLWTPTGVPG